MPERRPGYYFDLISILVDKEMKVRYNNSVLGYFWSIAHPLAFAVVFFVAFKIVMRIQMENYTLFLLAGLFPWQWFANSTAASPNIFVHNSTIIKKVNFPRNSLNIANIIQDAIHFLLSIPVFVLFMFIYGVHPSVSWAYGIPVLVAIQFATLYSISVVIASANLFIRDIERLVSLSITLLFYCTPIIYPISMVPDKYKTFVYLNPIAPLMICWRALLLEGRFDAMAALLAVGYAAVFLFISHRIFRKLSWKFAEVL